ncbi:hypothetical protein BGX27_006197, partial [Mortierella sp. AM989]
QTRRHQIPRGRPRGTKRLGPTRRTQDTIESDNSDDSQDNSAQDVAPSNTVDIASDITAAPMEIEEASSSSAPNISQIETDNVSEVPAVGFEAPNNSGNSTDSMTIDERQNRMRANLEQWNHNLRVKGGELYVARDDLVQLQLLRCTNNNPVVDATIAEKQQIVQELTEAVNLLQSGINEMTNLLNSHPSQADDTIPAVDMTVFVRSILTLKDLANFI